MSRRKERRRGGEGAPRRPSGGGPGTAGSARPTRMEPEEPRWGLAAQVGLLVAVFAIAAVIAELAGAANLGVALGVGQVAFAVVVVWLLARR